MSLEQLWAGWRAGYVASVTTPRSEDELDASPSATVEEPCVFCSIIASKVDDEARGVVHDAALSIALLNAYPYTSGHLLVLPRRHVGNLEDLDEYESVELWKTTRDSVQAITGAYLPDGINFGANLGRAAGAGIPGHLHLHVLPRWLGDTNFMTTVASTRVMPEDLRQSWAKLRASWPKSS